MAPQPRPGWDREDSSEPQGRPAGVLLLLYPRVAASDELHLVLTRRAQYPGTHGGQVSFPGGGQEGSEPVVRTALRETLEEIGVSSQDITILGRLTPLYIPPSNYRIHPFIGYRPTPPRFCRDEKEVAEIIELPLGLLFDASRRRSEHRVHPERGRFWVPYFDVYGHKVWGATAMVLAELVALLADEF